MIFITGQSGPQKRSIKISFNWDPHGAITVHTCTCEMILPIAIPLTIMKILERHLMQCQVDPSLILFNLTCKILVLIFLPVIL